MARRRPTDEARRVIWLRLAILTNTAALAVLGLKIRKLCGLLADVIDLTADALTRHGA